MWFLNGIIKYRKKLLRDISIRRVIKRIFLFFVDVYIYSWNRINFYRILSKVIVFEI